jgi:hypothetical protein
MTTASINNQHSLSTVRERESHATMKTTALAVSLVAALCLTIALPPPCSIPLNLCLLTICLIVLSDPPETSTYPTAYHVDKVRRTVIYDDQPLVYSSHFQPPRNHTGFHPQVIDPYRQGPRVDVGSGRATQSRQPDILLPKEPVHAFTDQNLRAPAGTGAATGSSLTRTQEPPVVVPPPHAQGQHAGVGSR